MKNLEQKRLLLLLPLVVLVLLGFTAAVGQMGENSDAEGILRLEDTLRRTAVSCYAAEGCYPPDLEYLQEHYGVQYDEARYVVYYDASASNLMPDITVLERSNENK